MRLEDQLNKVLLEFDFIVGKLAKEVLCISNY